jgi:hypothetical protein
MVIITYKRDVFTVNELMCLTVIAQKYMEMLVCCGSRPSGGIGFSFDTVCNYGICVLRCVGLFNPKLAL